MSRTKDHVIDLLRQEEAWLEAADCPIKKCLLCGELWEVDEDGHCYDCALWLKSQEEVSRAED